MEIGKTLGAIVLAGTMALGSCAAGLKVKIWEKSRDGYRLSIAKVDQKQDGKYDAIFLQVKKGDRLVGNMGFYDDDGDGNLDRVFVDNHGNNGLPDGIYDYVTPYNLFFKQSTGKLPLEKERELNHIYGQMVEKNK
ncbi:hypothetical protein GOV03_01090 [Candidatus Woesearchaeota archaeon]|nr:hypothetical protein [Candidatus Woesearchaeota archaeon]